MDVTEALESYRFNDAANAMYRFVWNVYCDWYVELAKPILLGSDEVAKTETRATVAWARDEVLKLLHPFIPFITEELWEVTGKRDTLLALTEWPSGPGTFDPRAEAEIGWVIEVITAIRSARAEMNVNALLPLMLARTSDQIWERAQRWSEFIKRMSRVSEISRGHEYPNGTMQLVVRNETIGLLLRGVIDLAAERARLDKEIAKADADIKRVDAKLGNEKFVANAPEEIVEEEKEKREAALARKAKIVEALERLKNAS